MASSNTVKPKEVSDEVYDKIKKRFFEECSENIEKGMYHPKDLERLKENNKWMKAFFKASEYKEDAAFDSMKDVLRWRKLFNANNLLNPGELTASDDLLKHGSIFMRNFDNKYRSIVYFPIKNHKKGQFPHLQHCKLIAFFFEKFYTFSLDSPVVILYDMHDVSLSNLDMDYTQFLMNSIRQFYPGLVDYMLVYQLPFIFNAAWKIIKNWLPSDNQFVKFVDKKSIKEFINKDQLLSHMGGSDTYVYEYDASFFNKNDLDKFVELDLNDKSKEANQKSKEDDKSKNKNNQQKKEKEEEIDEDILF